MTEQQQSICALLEQPDPPDLPPRAHRLTQAGDPRRHRQWIRLALAHRAYRDTSRISIDADPKASSPHANVRGDNRRM